MKVITHREFRNNSAPGCRDAGGHAGSRPRRLGLMIAAIASSRGLPSYTRDIDDFAGLDEMVTVVAV